MPLYSIYAIGDKTLNVTSFAESEIQGTLDGPANSCNLSMQYICMMHNQDR